MIRCVGLNVRPCNSLAVSLVLWVFSRVFELKMSKFFALLCDIITMEPCTRYSNNSFKIPRACLISRYHQHSMLISYQKYLLLCTNKELKKLDCLISTLASTIIRYSFWVELFRSKFMRSTQISHFMLTCFE